MSPIHPRRWLRFSLAGLLFLVLCWAGFWASFYLGTRRVVLNPDPFPLTVLQRSAQSIPGLPGQVSVSLGDITRGQAVATISDAKKTPLAGPISVRRGDVLTFQLNGQAYYLHVKALENQLIGEDRGILELSTRNRWPAARRPAAPASSADYGSLRSE